jgi:hypothetical protein
MKNWIYDKATDIWFACRLYPALKWMVLLCVVMRIAACDGSCHFEWKGSCDCESGERQQRTWKQRKRTVGKREHEKCGITSNFTSNQVPLSTKHVAWDRLLNINIHCSATHILVQLPAKFLYWFLLKVHEIIYILHFPRKLYVPWNVESVR